MEAEMAKHRINDLKKYMYEFKKEIVTNYHLKEVIARKVEMRARGGLREGVQLVQHLLGEEGEGFRH